jgi:cell division protein FtsB
MFDVEAILELHTSTVARWHREPVGNEFTGVLKIVCQQHLFNFELWHQEDIARSKEVTDQKIAEVKRAIDRLNQQRNDHIEKLDDWLTEQLRDASIQPLPDARLNTETPGSAIDRLSIMALRLYHHREQLQRDDVDADHLARVQQRIALCEQQRLDLSQSLRELLEDIRSGRRVHKTYRQMKMYNDPKLNPYLYQQSEKADPASVTAG